MSLAGKEKRLVKKLSGHKKDKGCWWYIRRGKTPEKKDANKFFFTCILDYQMKAEFVWGNAKKFIERFLNDPDNLWNVITAYSFKEWMKIADENSLHRFPKAKERVYRIACQIVDEYGGDARNIWLGTTGQEVSERLAKLQAGEQISHMILGALYDCGFITGTFDVKADIHVRRVLGRLLYGKELSADEALRESRRLLPKNPWKLDGKLFSLGKQYCYKEPDCENCDVYYLCKYYAGNENS